MKKRSQHATRKFQLEQPSVVRPPRRRPRSNAIHYVPDVASQVDFVHGTPVIAVPPDHVAWKVKKSLELFDLDPLHAKASPLGRHGYHPSHKLGPWLLASITGVKSATELARRLQTDAAYRLLSGGNEISADVLGCFRRENLLFFNLCVNRTIEVAWERGYVDLEETALDSVRLEADAAQASIRTAERSARMVKELSAKDTSELTPERLARHEARLAKHKQAVSHCEEMDVTNYSVTDPLAALMKFPHGGSKPGHRLTTVVAGAAIRFCVGFYLSSKPTDHDLLAPTLEALRDRLDRVGVPSETFVKVAVDAGFCSEQDLKFACSNSLHIDTALAQQSFDGAGHVNAKGMFGKERFQINGDEAICPAGTKMSGPYRDSGSIIKWLGVGCEACPLRAQCTTANARKIRHNPSSAEVREELRRRMEDPDRKALYSKRPPIVESMYSVLEDAMGFRRVSSRHRATVQAEIVMKILAYNLTRLWVADAKKLCRLYVLATDAWPEALVAAVVDFLMALQATNLVGATSNGPERNRAS